MHRQALLRLLFFIAGALFLVLAVLAIVLPVVPTTPFLLLAVACFARTSRRFHDWLVSRPFVSKIVHDWNTHRSVPRRTKLAIYAMLALSLSISFIFFVKDRLGRTLLVLVALLTVALVSRIPTRAEPRDAEPAPPERAH
jgi:hypothetical protein